jgi:glycosyltransferase involved in cell wall biosynthesis
LPQPDLSLCMIVRDEQEMLPDFLASVAGLWDELVIADTGSRDETVSLVESAGAKIIHFPWIDDFSAARNASLAAATGRWILFLDADERPTPELVRQIRELLNDPDAGAATVVMRNQWVDGGRRDNPLLRLFLNDPSIRFQHRIHEDVSTGVRDFLRDGNLQLRHLPGIVHHLGYSRETASSRDKKTRDLALLNRSLEADPRDFYCWFKIMEIARFWADRPLWEKTAQRAADLLATAGDEEKADLRQRSYSGEFASLVAQGLDRNDQGRLYWLEKSREFCTPDSIWLLRRGLFLENLNLHEEARLAFHDCLAHEDDHLIHLSTVRPRLGLCRLAIARNDLQRAAGHAKLACEAGPTDPEALLAAVTCLPLVENEGHLEDFVTRHLEAHPLAGLELAKALFRCGLIRIAGETLAPLAKGCPEAALGYLVSCLVSDQDVDLNLDLEQEEADRIFKEWIHLLWQSRKTDRMEAFADHCTRVLEIFPWLPDFLQQETRLLQ